MPNTAPPSSTIRAYYRRLYKAGLHSVLYSKPSRFVVRDCIRYAFRNYEPSRLEPARVERTLEFLSRAARVSGLEHRIVRNVTHVWWMRNTQKDIKGKQLKEVAFQRTAYEGFERTLQQLNDSMGMCLYLDSKALYQTARRTKRQPVPRVRFPDASLQ
ncbi:DUF1763-domain-containing protein [Polychaeton citri CBS 116435]|uniref:DUF1763-domain-containing protein n=1 Tax=Polychaeton citri CBS 116435 TaxID=1314669 RepID=A0A9P4URH2_9PEZI|nr:DUF1763-domain-containing protein [Polychaeton citri CBS 116435]